MSFCSFCPVKIFDVYTNAQTRLTLALSGVGAGVCTEAEEWGLNVTRTTVEIQLCPRDSLSSTGFCSNYWVLCFKTIQMSWAAWCNSKIKNKKNSSNNSHCRALTNTSQEVICIFSLHNFNYLLFDLFCFQLNFSWGMLQLSCEHIFRNKHK